MEVIAECVRQGKAAQKTLKATYTPRPDLAYDLLGVVDERGRATQYRLEELPNIDFPGRGFRLTKIDDTSYHLVAHESLALCHCDCRGFEARGTCKHLWSIRALIEGGLIPDPLAGPDHDDYPVQSDPKPCERCRCPLDEPFDTYCDPCKALVRSELAEAVCGR